MKSIEYDNINVIHWKRVNRKNLYTGDIKIRYKEHRHDAIQCDYLTVVKSYNTIIGFYDKTAGLFWTWGYRSYSPTTSKHITTLCNTHDLIRLDIRKYSYDEFIKHYLNGDLQQ